MESISNAPHDQSPDSTESRENPSQASPAQGSYSKALLLALSVFEVSPEGKVVPKPLPAELMVLAYRDGAWQQRSLSDPDSNVFHKAMFYDPGNGTGPGILTLGGTQAVLKLWRKGQEPEVLWKKDFGGKFSRMRDAEAADLFGEGRMDLAVATHDQGVVALVRPNADGSFAVTEIDHRPDTFVHEIEIGDLDKDGTLEVYATPSAPNKLDGTPQPGFVVRYVPAKGEGPVVVADLGTRHAKEILVKDVDGDGTDELYVSVEMPTEILRFDAGTDPKQGKLIARLDDELCRFLTAGDVDGDGKLEIVAAGHKSGLWLLRPGVADAPWSVESIDRDSGGFEHAALLTDLDEDGRDELYAASDRHGEIRRYVWVEGIPKREVIYRFAVPGSVFVWNIMPAPVEVVPVAW